MPVKKSTSKKSTTKEKKVTAKKKTAAIKSVKKNLSKNSSKKKTTTKKTTAGSNKKKAVSQKTAMPRPQDTLRSLEDRPVSETPLLAERKFSQPVVHSAQDVDPVSIRMPETETHQYLVTLLLTILVVIGVFGAVNYFLAKDKEPWMPTADSSIVIVNPVTDSNVEVDIISDEQDESTEVANDEAGEDQVDLQALAVETNVAIYNGSGFSGVATTYAGRMAEAGFNIVTIANADSFDYQTTLIQYTDALEPDLLSLIQEIFVDALEPVLVEDLEYDVIVTIGKSIN